MHTPSFYRTYGLPLFVQRFLAMNCLSMHLQLLNLSGALSKLFITDSKQSFTDL